MKKVLSVICLVLFVFVVSILYDFGIPVSGNDILMLKEINSEGEISIHNLNGVDDKEVLLTGVDAVDFIKKLTNRDYYRISYRRYQGSFLGEHQLIFAKNKEGHSITIELCGEEKMSIKDEMESKSEYFRIR